jgi:hypothetical protein
VQAGIQELIQPPSPGATGEIAWPTLASASIGALSLIATDDVVSPYERHPWPQGVPLQRPPIQRTARSHRTRPGHGLHGSATRALSRRHYPFRLEAE